MIHIHMDSRRHGQGCSHVCGSLKVLASPVSQKRALLVHTGWRGRARRGWRHVQGRRAGRGHRRCALFNCPGGTALGSGADLGLPCRWPGLPWGLGLTLGCLAAGLALPPPSGASHRSAALCCTAICALRAACRHCADDQPHLYRHLQGSAGAQDQECNR